MTGTDLVTQFGNDLVIRDDDTGQPVAVRFPGGGDISLGDLDGLALWLRTVIDLERIALREVKSLVGEHITLLLDEHAEATGTYTYHTRDGIDVSVESRGTAEEATTIDVAGLHKDLMILRQRAGASFEDALATVDSFFIIERKLSDSGKKKLLALGSAYAEALDEHTQPAERARKAPSVRRAR
jgi:hypothetical protein